MSVYYEDTDFSGAVYHANYFKFIERARSHIISSAGIDQLKLKNLNMVFMVTDLSAKFMKTAYFGDSLEVKTHLLKIGGASIQLEQKVLRNETCIFLADVKLGLVSKGRAVRLPNDIRNKIVALD